MCVYTPVSMYRCGVFVYTCLCVYVWRARHKQSETGHTINICICACGCVPGNNWYLILNKSSSLQLSYIEYLIISIMISPWYPGARV